MATTREGDPAAGRRYHHGELRAALIAASFELLSEVGMAGFSVAQLARRLGVSTAAPYRHFRDRDELLAAVATEAAGELTTAMRIAADAAGPDSIDRFAATAGAYVRYVSARGAGFTVIFAESLRHLRDAGLAEAGRELMTLLLELAQKARPLPPAEALQLLEQHVAIAHGYITLHTDGFLDRSHPTVEEIAARATRASAALVRGTGTV
ncbi:TetR/AcrR family transcriptional regulator [Pseudonocardia alaniniphila]|uniref:TetR/AcrR family transcriptional regulator n=1 Tax=Pseudonocardia alaniniphila TaxID=75291 RepID=A0ABS9TG73_9PSEU|nr:TetR/AcrR family transcriptional regulator [Pseudonocardia alaniniphila]MCH6167535.1 TetR/AcrR family transcriptional regulator [Pseudonocardia alaniniphila]